MDYPNQVCFLCLKEIKAGKETKGDNKEELLRKGALSLQCIYRYLNIDRNEISKLPNNQLNVTEVPGKDAESVNFSDSEVQLCPGRCLDLMCKFKELFESLEEIQMRTEACLGTVLEYLEANKEGASSEDHRHQVLCSWRKLINEKGWNLKLAIFYHRRQHDYLITAAFKN